jgi:hypothetical protein
MTYYEKICQNKKCAAELMHELIMRVLGCAIEEKVSAEATFISMAAGKEEMIQAISEKLGKQAT